MEPVITKPILNVDDEEKGPMGFNYVLKCYFQVSTGFSLNKGLEIKLPGMNGLKSTRIKEIVPNLPMMAGTSYVLRKN